VFLYLYRRGVGPSTDQGTNAVDLMNSESAAHGQPGRNALQLQPRTDQSIARQISEGIEGRKREY